MKERLGLTEIRKQANRMSFGEVGPLTTIAMGPWGPFPSDLLPSIFLLLRPMAPTRPHQDLGTTPASSLVPQLQSPLPAPKGPTQPSALAPSPCSSSSTQALVQVPQALPTRLSNSLPMPCLTHYVPRPCQFHYPNIFLLVPHAPAQVPFHW